MIGTIVGLGVLVHAAVLLPQFGTANVDAEIRSSRAERGPRRALISRPVKLPLVFNPRECKLTYQLSRGNPDCSCPSIKYF